VPAERSVIRALAFAAAALGVVAPLAGSPYAARHASIDVTELANVVAREEDHVTAVELAQWIRERRRDLRLIDIRDAESFATYHVPTAERLSLDSLVQTAFPPDETIVLYSDGGAHAAQGWTFLRALGYRRVFFLRGGLNEWLETVITPTLPEHPSASARGESEKIAALSRYFGGSPKVVAGESPEGGSAVPLPQAVSASLQGQGRSTSANTAIIARMRKRGC
jgi:rhodanese-related sulfurtransferase